jgi:exosome complex RNA-binding protein Rrp4
MAEAEDVVQNVVPGDNVDEDPLGWVAPGPRETASQISSTTIGVFTIVEERAEGAPCHWRA